MGDFPPRSGTRQGYELSPPPFNIVMEVPGIAVMQGKKKGFHIGKEDVKLLFAGDVMVDLENSKDSIKKNY